MPDHNESISIALARIPSGCSILTAATPHARTGMLASWVQQAGFDPPTVSVAVKKGRPIETIIDESNRFTLNLIGENPAPLFRHFGRGFDLTDDAFKGLPHTDIPGGVSLPDTIATLSCEVTGKHDTGDHWLYIARVTAAETRDASLPYVHIRKSGASY